MSMRPLRAAEPIALALASLFLAAPAFSMTTTECHEKYHAAKSAGTLNGLKWSDFKKAQCDGSTPAHQSVADTPAKTKSPAAKSSAVFPSAVSPKYVKESSGRARLHTCRDQYETNKVSNGNGGLRWIEKGGGYYSQCTKRLKG